MVVRFGFAVSCASVFVAFLPVSVIADSAATGVSGPWSINVELRKVMEQKLKFDSSTDSFVVGTQTANWESSGGTEKIKREDALLKIAYQVTPIAKFSALVGTTKVHSSDIFDATKGSTYGIGFTATMPSTSTWAMGLSADILRSTAKENGVPINFYANSSDGLPAPFSVVYGDVKLDNKLESTQLNLSAVATYNSANTKPYFGLLYSSVSGKYTAHLHGNVTACSGPCLSSAMTLDEKTDISLDSQLGLIFGANTAIADNASIGIGAIFGTRTEYFAQVGMAF